MPPRRVIIGHHLILTLYGHWLGNDPRGSGSVDLHDEKFAPLGPIHHGRKIIQPPRQELREFYRQADPLLNFEKFWLDDAKRQALAEAFTRVARQRGYTVWACAILGNHAHLAVRRHRDDAMTMWNYFAQASCDHLRLLPDIVKDHPVWSQRPYKVFMYTPRDVEARVRYIEDNPEKEGLPPQQWAFVVPYNGWPLHKK